MAEFEFDLRDIFRIVRRRKWVIVLCPILAALVFYLFSQNPPPIYQAEALVKISRVAGNMQALLIEALSFYQGDNIATQSQIITSQKMKARVALRLADKYPEFAGIKALLGTLESVDSAEFEEALRNSGLVDLISTISVQAERKGSSDIVGIQSTASSEALAIDIANYTAEEFVDYNVEEKNRQIHEAVRFIRARIQETEQELSNLERRLEEFKTEHAAVLALRGVDGQTRQDEVNRLQRRIAELERGIQELKETASPEQYFALFPTPGEEKDALISRLEQQLLELTAQTEELRVERRQLLAYRTEASREVRQNLLKMEEVQRRTQETMGALVLRYEAIHEDLKEQYVALTAHQNLIRRLPEVSRQLESLERQSALKTDALNLLQSRLQDAEIQRAGEIKEMTIVEQATSFSTLPQPSRILKALVGLMIGTILGGVFAFILESLDTSIGTIDEVERYLRVPVLGVIPHLDVEMVHSKILLKEMGTEVSERDLDRIATLCTHFAPTEPVSEAFRTLRAQLDVLMKRNGWKTLMVTSSVLQEGKTSVASNLAVVFAQSGQRTLLIDADLRRPQVHKVFGVLGSPGLGEVLLKVTDWEGATKSIDDLILGKLGLKNSHLTPGLEYLFLLTCGRKVESPAELLNPDKFSTFLGEIRDRYDVIIIDAAPVLPVADASQLAMTVDAILSTYQIGRVGREVVNRSKNRLEAVGGNVIGLVMNDIQAEIYYARDFEYYSYKYKYEEAPTPRATPGFLGRMKSRLSKVIGGYRRAPRTSVVPPPAPGVRSREPRQDQTKPPSSSPSRGSELEDIMKLTDEES